ncbi:MAG: hypothetical protein WBE65_09590, partial [Steroidobacteraceae bacterium]
MPTTANSGLRLIGLCVAGVAALGASFGSALAADTNASDQLQEVTVTATKLGAQNVMDVPATIQAISGDELQRQSASGI